LVDLLGKKKLEERIAELQSQVGELNSKVALLEEERSRLSHQLEKREEKIRKLTHSCQEVNLELKAAEQKISTLRTVKSETTSVVKTPATRPQIHSDEISPAVLKSLLQRLETCRSPSEDLVSAYLRKGADAEVNLPKEVCELAENIPSDRGIAFFSYPQLFTLAVAPPFPLTKTEIITGPSFHLAPLKHMLDVPVLAMVARAGETFLGVALSCEGFEERNIVKSTVKEKHSKGGWSQKRFERLREEDIRQHAELVKREIPTMLEGYRQLLIYAVVSGDPLLTKQILPALDLPVLNMKLGRFDRKRTDEVLDEVYKSVSYRR